MTTRHQQRHTWLGERSVFQLINRYMGRQVVDGVKRLVQGP